jgi:flagellar basal-body rod protein FlgB
VFIGDVINSGSMPSLEAMLRFSGERHRLIAHNIANLETPNYRPLDVSPQGFQRALAAAIEERRSERGSVGELRLETSEVAVGEDGRMTLSPRTPSSNILFHDRNNRDLERLMQDHAENAGVYRMAADLLRSRYQQLKDAMAERV